MKYCCNVHNDRRSNGKLHTILRTCVYCVYVHWWKKVSIHFVHFGTSKLSTFSAFSSFTSHRSISFSLSVQFPTTAFVYIHRNQPSNRSTVNKVPIGKNKVPGSENVHSSEFEILALYIYIIVYNITRGYSVPEIHTQYTYILPILRNLKTNSAFQLCLLKVRV